MSKNSSNKATVMLAGLSPWRRVAGVLGWVGLLAASFVVANVVVIAAVRIVGELGVDLYSLNLSLLNLVVAAIIYILFAGVMIGFPWLVLGIKSSWQDLGMPKQFAWKNIIALPTAVLVYVATTVTFALIASQFAGYDATEVQETGFTDLSANYEYVAAFVALVIIAPVAEEVLFRGFLHGKLRRLVGRTGAIVVGAAVFGLIHGQANVSVDTFALGLVLGLLREYTGSVYSGILLHMGKNGLAYYLLFVSPLVLPGV